MSDKEGANRLVTIVALAVVGSVGVVGLTLVVVCEDHEGNALQSAATIATLVGMIAGFIVTVAKIHRVQEQTNSRWDEMTAIIKQVAKAEGVAEEHQRNIDEQA